MRAYHLQAEYRTNPLGIDSPRPLLRWKCKDGLRQTASQVRVWGEADTLVFDSGKTVGSSMGCRYAGALLRSMQRLRWAVTVWDENGIPEASEPAWFEMALAPEDWQSAVFRWTEKIISALRLFPAEP